MSDEISVTEEMIEAGRKANCLGNPFDPLYVRVYRAMAAMDPGRAALHASRDVAVGQVTATAESIADDIIEKLSNDPEIWLTHGLPSEDKLSRISATIVGAYRAAVAEMISVCTGGQRIAAQRIAGLTEELAKRTASRDVAVKRLQRAVEAAERLLAENRILQATAEQGCTHLREIASLRTDNEKWAGIFAETEQKRQALEADVADKERDNIQLRAERSAWQKMYDDLLARFTAANVDPKPEPIRNPFRDFPDDRRRVGGMP